MTSATMATGNMAVVIYFHNRLIHDKSVQMNPAILLYGITIYPPSPLSRIVAEAVICKPRFILVLGAESERVCIRHGSRLRYSLAERTVLVVRGNDAGFIYQLPHISVGIVCEVIHVGIAVLFMYRGQDATDATRALQALRQVQPMDVAERLIFT